MRAIEMARLCGGHQSGEDPVVVFLHGPPMRVKGDSLKVVPPWMSEQAQQNLHQIERWLDVRIHGCTSRTPTLAPRPDFDLEEAMARQATHPACSD